MFKLTKILSSGSSLPDPVRLPIDKSYRYITGGLGILHKDKLIPARATDIPTHLIGETPQSREVENIIAYEITSRMIFEVPIESDPEKERIGNRLLIDDMRGMSDAVISGIGGAAMIIDMNNAKRAGDKLYVLFPERKE